MTRQTFLVNLHRPSKRVNEHFKSRCNALTIVDFMTVKDQIASKFAGTRYYRNRRYRTRMVIISERTVSVYMHI